MCTVTFIPAGDRVFITHNRDEKRLRPPALAPAVHHVHGHTLLFPRDAQAGGSWIAANANGEAAVLLNGAFIKHETQPPYRKSRGLVLVDIMASDDGALSWQQADLSGIEPFTMILWSKGRLYEGRWDGRRKYTAEPDAAQAHIWSSVTLYEEAVQHRRRQWFARWRQQCPQPEPADILQYHLQGGEGDTRNDLRMNRNDVLLTVSITGMTLLPGECRMQYMDLQGDAVYAQDFLLTDNRLMFHE